MNISKKNHFILIGSITGLLMVVHSVFMYGFRMPPLSPLQYICNVIYIAGVFTIAFRYSKAHNNYVLFSDVYKNCFKGALVTTSIFTVGSIICLLIFPGVMNESMEMAKHFSEKKNVPAARIAESGLIMKKYFFPMAIVSVFFGTLIWGAVFSLIGAAIVKKKGEKIGSSPA